MVNLIPAQRAFNYFKASGISGRVLILTGNTAEKGYITNQRGAAFNQWASGALALESDMLVIIHKGGVDFVKKHMNGDKSDDLPEKNGSVRRFGDIAACIQASGGAPLVGMQRELDLQKSDFTNKVKQAIAAAGGLQDETAAVNALISDVLAVKDDKGLENSKKAGALCTAILKRAITPELEKIAASLETSRVEDFAASISGKLNHPRTIPGLEGMEASNYANGYIDVPCVFAGESASQLSVRTGGIQAFVKLPQVSGTFAKAQSVGLIFGAKFAGYNVGIGRTFFLNQAPSNETKKTYKALLALEQAIVTRLGVTGTTFGQVYSGALEDVAKAGTVSAELLAALPAEFGGVIGLHSHDHRLGLNGEKSGNTKIEAGMIVVVRLLVLPKDAKEAGANIGDTSVVICNSYHIGAGNKVASITRTSPPIEECIILAAKKEEAQSDDDDDDEAENGKRDRRVGKDSAPVTKSIITTRAAKGLMPDMSAEQNRIASLKNLLKKKHEAWIAAGRPRGGADAAAVDELRIFELGRLGLGLTTAYPSFDAAPSQYTQLRNDVALDRTKMALWLPLNGPSAPLTPIHVSAIAKAEMRSAGQQEHYFTVTFHSTQEGNFAFRSNRTKVFVRETTFCGPDSGKFFNITAGIKDLQATIKAKDTERKAKQGVVQQGGLKTTTQPDRLPQVKCRPPPAAAGRGARGAGAGCEGNLEAHDNGFRFTYNGGFIDILYDNVKFMISQPSKNDIMVIFHLALRNAVMVGTKKTDHIQFVAEVMEGTTAVTSTRMTQEEEEAREERDADRIRKTNLQFAQFAKKVQERSGIAAQQPFSNVNFEGSASRGTVNFRGNESCLWSIIEMPFFVMSMENVEVVALERVITGNINFDLAFVQKDYRTVQTITTVPMTDLERVKEWLLRADCIFFEATINLTWNSVLKQIRDDPGWVPFSEKGGWATMMEDFLGGSDDDEDEEAEGDGDDDDDDDDEDSDDTYEDEEDDTDDDWSGDTSSEDDDDEDEDEDDSDEDYDDSDDSDDRRKSKKHKAEKTKRR